jgi:hypothetical protein
MKRLTPIKAIRAKCLDCSNHQPKEVRLCPVTNCPLWLYRMGKRPKSDGHEDDVKERP